MVTEWARTPTPDLWMPRWLWCSVHLHLQVWVHLSASCQLSEPKLFLTGLAIFLSLMFPALPTEFLPTSMYVLQWQDNIPEMHLTDFFEQCRHSLSRWPSDTSRHYWVRSVTVHVQAGASLWTWEQHVKIVAWKKMPSVWKRKVALLFPNLLKGESHWSSSESSCGREISPPLSEYCTLITSH